MKKLYLSITLFCLLLLSSVNAQDAPILLAPLDGDRHVKTNKLTLLWFAIEGVEQYKIQLATHPDFLPEAIIFDVNRTTASVIAPELSNLTTYYWRVKIDDPASPWSNAWRFTTTGFASIVNLTSPEDGTNNLDTDVIEFEWEKDSVNSSYNLQISTDPEFPDTIRNVFVDEETADVTNLQAGLLHYWRVKSFNVDGIEGDWSDVSSFKTRLRKPTLISPTNFANNQDTTIIFRWTRVSTASIYDFQISIDETFPDDQILFDTSLTNDRLRFEDMLNDQIYYWRLKSRNAFSDSSLWSEPFAFKTRLSKPKLLLPLDETRNNELNITLSWTPGDEFDFYHVQVAEDSLFKNLHTNTFAESNTASLLNLEKNKFYYWRINRQNSDGDSSSWSNRFGFKTKLETPALLLPENNFSKFSFNTTFEWSKIDSAEYYLFQLSNNDSFTDIQLNEVVSDTLKQIDSLKINQSFFWRVRAENERTDTSEWSETFRINISAISLSSLEIDTTINFSSDRIDTISSIQLENSSNEILNLSSIFAQPDSLFTTSVSELVLNAFEKIDLKIIADTSKIDTGLTGGTLNFVRLFDSTEDTTRIPIRLFSKKAVAGFSMDTLDFDSTFSSLRKNKLVRLNNRLGNITLNISELTLEQNEGEAFILNTELEKIGAGDSANISITFDPQVKDTNTAYLVAKTNSYPEREIRVFLTGIGLGGIVSESTKSSFNAVSDSTFITFSNDTQKLTIENSGDYPLDFSLNLVENYFDIETNLPLPIRLQANDTTSFTLKYNTPNFDTLNIDTLIFSHNGIGDKEFKFPLQGSFDKSKAIEEISKTITVNNNLLNTISSAMQLPNETAIQVRYDNTLFEDEDNIEFKIVYFVGGPGSKQNALNADKGRKVIPFQKVNKNGLLFKGELFTNGIGSLDKDSLTIFDFIDVQVEVNNYKTADVNVPLSTAAEKLEDANVNWVLFGYPFNQVLSDSVFSDLGDPTKMQDGQWVVYDYNSGSDNFELLSSNLLEAGQAFFIAQEINERVNLSYKYENTVLTRKLSDNIIELNETGWKTISSPYTFEVEVDTPAVLYRYDTFTKSYKLTSIMRPGEGYFVPPNISELRLINFGEYFPSVFPKAIADSDWMIDIQFSNGKKSEQLFVAGKKGINELFKTSGEKGFVKAPKIDNYFEAYFSDDAEIRMSALLNEPLHEFVTNLVIESGKNETIELKIALEKEMQSGYSFAIIDEFGNKIRSNEMLSILGNNKRNLQFVYGTSKFISNKINEIKNLLTSEFSLAQNYPNPFNPSTTIRYSIPVVGALSEVEGRHVTLRIFDILGRVVATLVNVTKVPGKYEVTWDASAQASGVYFYELKAGEFTETKKLLLLK